jgi:hypothetical protein
MQYEKLKKNLPQLLSMTGFTIEVFEEFLPHFSHEWEEYNAHFTLFGKERQRTFYRRKTSVLPLVEDKLLFILSYLKNNPLQEYHAATFGLNQPQCNFWIHLLKNILLKTLKTLRELPERNCVRVERILQSYDNVLLDGTERPIQRPQASERQKSCYSGKKKIIA